ncbi:MAG: DUF4115 domain-containing protein [Candidatus Rokubacteria bacterium]|nr:DUF4115 domain-containing protein [Candidatus Rokubacteria bacterium]
MAQSLGAYFRELRLVRGVSLDEVARATRVSQRYLEALEADRLDDLPAPVFTKGFIRAYAQVLREPPDEALARYRELAGDSAVEAPPVTATRSFESRGRGPALVSLALLIGLGAGLFGLTLSLKNRTPKVSVPAQPSPPPAQAPVAPPSPSAENAVNVVEASPARLVARTNEPTWISVQTDDGRIVQELLPAGATREWTSPKRFLLTIGNAGGVSLELNGRPLPPLGARGAVIRQLVIPAEPGIPTP